MAAVQASGAGAKPPRQIEWTNLGVGAALQLFEVTTLGQPFEVMKTQLAAYRSDSFGTAMKNIYARGGLRGFWQGLIPWAWIEAVTKGGVLMLTAVEIRSVAEHAGADKGLAAMLGGVGGGVCQAYTTMGLCTFMKTVEVTREKGPDGKALEGTLQVAKRIFQKEGVRGMYKGVSAVAVRQATNWGSRFGISRVTENLLKGGDKNRKLSNAERLGSSVVGGALACWNQPIEVIRVEMQSVAKSEGRPEKVTIGTTAKYIYKNNGIKGFFRGVLPRIGLSVYLTSCMVFGGDELKAIIKARKERAAAQDSFVQT